MSELYWLNEKSYEKEGGVLLNYSHREQSFKWQSRARDWIALDRVAKVKVCLKLIKSEFCLNLILFYVKTIQNNFH